MRRGPRAVWVALGIAALAVAGYAAWRHRPPAPPDCAGLVPDDFSKQGLLAAMLSVHRAAYCIGHPHDASGVCASPDLMPLLRAATVLRCDPSALAIARRKRAIAKLQAYGWRTPAFDRELAVLGLHVRALRRLVGETLPGSLLAWYLHRPPWFEWYLAHLIAAKPVLVAGADADSCDALAEAPYDPPSVTGGSLTATTDVYVTVAPALDAVKQNVDPQRWDECSKFWPEPDGTYLAGTLSLGCAVALPVPEEIAPPRPGDEYRGRRLFEHFMCAKAGCQTDFKNVLAVDVYSRDAEVLPSKTVPAHLVEYSLPRCGLDGLDGFIEGDIAGQPGATVTTDQGTMWIWEEGRRHVKAHKEVGFGNFVNTGTAAAVLGFARDELAQELGELACCAKQGTSTP